MAYKNSKLLALACSPLVDWSMERRRDYGIRARRVVDGLRGVCQSMEAWFDETAQQAEAVDHA
jgi:hypothetical protein